MNEKVIRQFNEVAHKYDEQRRLLIPCFDDFYGTAVRWAQTDKPSPRILDLGAGTGLLAEGMRTKYPACKLTLIDLGDKMLDIAKQRFAAVEEIEYIVADYTEYPFEHKFDLIVSSLSIHHLTHEAKQTLFHRIYGLLEDGGLFINADQVMGETHAVDQLYKQMWVQWIRTNGISTEAADASIERRKLDINAKAWDQLRWLQEAGFQESDCVYKYQDFAVFYAKKSE
ncbi:class I SAM-dependent methyltransferase [Paenibacillus sp. NPDC056579]|uniref:class I SAM-dependent methyltransferase n=1 Tax=Paenibacillus sp. NPDC056579 TaxID=3345871 RepID=UPI0036C53694